MAIVPQAATTRALAARPVGVLVILAGLVPALAGADEAGAGTARPRLVEVDGGEIQAAIDAAPPHSVVACNRNRQVTLATPLKVRKPLTLRGLNLRLPDRLGGTPLVVVQSAGVAVTDFELRGNGDTVPQDQRAPLLVVEAGDFRVERGVFLNSSKDGLMIDGGALAGADLSGGVVRDVVGRDVIRDVVSIGGSGSEGRRIRNVLVDNVRSYNSRLRGAVEVSDGSENVTVRKVYAERCVYAVDVQDHGDPGQINRNVLVEDVYARDCTHAIRTANKPLGHANLTMRDIVAERCTAPLAIRNTANVVLQGVTVVDHASKQPPVLVANCDGLSVRDVTVQGGQDQGPAVVLQDCDEALVDGVNLRGRSGGRSAAVAYRLTTDETFSGLRISHVLAPGAEPAGILLEREKGRGTLTDYLISGNLARVVDRIQGARGLVADNLPAAPTELRPSASVVADKPGR